MRVWKTAMVGAALTASLAFAQRQPSQDDFDWLNKYRWEVLDSVLPIEGTDAAVLFRSYRDLYQDIEERYFMVSFDPRQRTYTAVVVRPEGKSLQQQLLDGHIASPTTSADLLRKQLRFRQSEVTEADCPGLRRQMTALARLSVRTPERDLIVLHPVVYHIVINAGGGTLDARLVDDEHPLVKWAVATDSQLERCATRKTD